MVVMQGTIESQSKMVEEGISKRTTFGQALRDKYVDQEELDNRLILPKDNMITTEITFVGFGKVTSIQKQLKHLTSIDLSSRCIASRGDMKDLVGCLESVQMLNLADNSLTWSDIVSILFYTPNLRELIISRNELNNGESIHDLPASPSRRLKSLTVGRVYLDWSSIIKVIARIWSQVEQLDLWDNGLSDHSIESVTMTNDFIRKLGALRLSNNRFTGVSWLTKIGPLDSLTELDLSRCRIRSISINHVISKQLNNLTFLNVSYNDIDTWTSISELHKLDKLKSLICLENPVYVAEKFAKFLTVGRLGKLKVLNREEITNGQRRDSEIFYLRRTFPEFQLYKNGQLVDFKQLHPRYEELLEIYGLPEDLIKKHVEDKFINVELCFGEGRITKKLPCDMRVANVKMLCKKLFNLKPSCVLELTYCETQPIESGISYVLDKDGQSLHFFSVKNGRRLIIKELD